MAAPGQGEAISTAGAGLGEGAQRLGEHLSEKEPGGPAGGWAPWGRGPSRGSLCGRRPQQPWGPVEPSGLSSGLASPAHLGQADGHRCESGEQMGSGWLSPLCSYRRKHCPCVYEAEAGKGKVKSGPRGVSWGVRSPTELELDRPRHSLLAWACTSLDAASAWARRSPVHRGPFLRLWNLAQRQVCEASVWGASPASGVPRRPCRGHPAVDKHGSFGRHTWRCGHMPRTEPLPPLPPLGGCAWRARPVTPAVSECSPPPSGASSPPRAGGVPPRSASCHARAVQPDRLDRTLRRRCVCDRPRGQQFQAQALSRRSGQFSRPHSLA